MIDFKEARKKVSIIEILVDWGYKFDKSKGAVRPNFVLRDEFGKEIDRVIVTNPKDSANQGYWRRDGSRGDLISFIKENINQFPVVGRNEVDTLNKILAYLMGVDDSDHRIHGFNGSDANTNGRKWLRINREFDLEDYLDEMGIHEAKEFDISHFVRKNGVEHIDELMKFFETRGITRETVEVFAPWIEMVAKDNTTPDGVSHHKIWNVGFPYRVPGSQEIAGYEVRNKGFKGKAEGTNSTTALWIASPTPPHLSAPLPSEGRAVDSIRFVFLFESAIDAMAFYQRHQDLMKSEECVFASTGGSFSDQQITGTMAYYRRAKAVDCFDNDLQGRIYGCRMVALLEGSLREKSDKNLYKNLSIKHEGEVVKFEVGDKHFELAADLMDVETFRALTGIYGDKVIQRKAPEGCKDWNDAVKNDVRRGNSEESSNGWHR